MKAKKENVIRFGDKAFYSGSLVSVYTSDGVAAVGEIGFINDFGFSLSIKETDKHVHAKVIQYDWILNMDYVR